MCECVGSGGGAVVVVRWWWCAGGGGGSTQAGRPAGLSLYFPFTLGLVVATVYCLGPPPLPARCL